VSNITPDSEKKVGGLARIGQAVRNMRGEMKRVVWPSRKQVLNNTGVVLFFMVIAAVVIGGFDALLSMITMFAFGA